MGARGIFTSVVFCLSFAAQADISFVILESALNTPLSVAINQGHAVLFFDRVCPETPVKLTWCKPGQQGAVLSRYGNISKENYDWMAVAPSTFFSGVDRAENAPII